MAHTGVGHGTNMAHIVSLWSLQFDYFSAQLGQNLSRKGPMITEVRSRILTPARGPSIGTEYSTPMLIPE